MTTHLVIPDAQVKPGVPLDHLRWLGNYIVAKKPDVIINIGDFADMESLSSYDVGKKSFEGRRYKADVQAAHDGMSTLLHPLYAFNDRQRKNGKKQYRPKMILTLGNHENRIDRAVNNDSKLDGVLSVDDLKYENWGWAVYPFLEVVMEDGVAYSHYFVSGAMGRPCVSAQSQLNKHHTSCVAGHQQGLQIATGKRADGALLTSIIAGSFYLHDEDYNSPQGNQHWRGAMMLHNVEGGSFDLNLLPMQYLEKRFDY